MKTIKVRWAFLGVFLAAAISFSQETYSQWSKYRVVTVNTTNSGGGANVTGAVTNFPLLVRLTSANADVFSQALASGADIRFTDSTGTTRLKHQRERWDASNQAADFWVLVPAIAGSAGTSIRMYWGKSGAADSSKASAVFDTANGFVGVWHLGDAAGSSPRPSAVPAAPSAQLRNFGAGYAPVPGAIGMCDTMAGVAVAGLVGDYLDLGFNTDFSPTNYSGYANFTTGISYSIWVYSAAVATFERFLNLSADSSGAGALATSERIVLMGNQNGSTTAPNLAAREGVGGVQQTNFTPTTNTKAYAANSWYQFFISKAAGTGAMTIDTNGALYGTTAATWLPLANVNRNYFWIGRSAATTDGLFRGKFDEPVLSKVPRSADWRRLSYTTQRPGATAVAVGSTISTAAVPGAPTGATATAGNAQATVVWVAPSSDGGAAITAYTVTSAPEAKTCATTGGLTCTVTGLTNGTAYTFTVTATNAGGTGAASAVSNSVTPVAPPGVPGQPTSVLATVANAQSVISWTAPTSDGGSAITAYTATSNPDNKTCATTGALTCTVTALTNGTSYTFTVTATNSSGPSAPSVPSATVIPVTVPTAPPSIVAAAGNAQVVLTWTASASSGGSAITGYTVTSVQDTSKHCLTTGTLTCTVTGLTNGTAYTFTVTAKNAVGTSSASGPSASVTPVTVPGAPTITSVVGASGQVTVTWTAPASTGGSAITGYTATAVQDTSKHCSTSAALNCAVTGLTNATSYTFTVAAINAVGIGTASAASASVTGIFSGATKMSLRKMNGSVSLRLPEFSGSALISIIDAWGRTVLSRTVTEGTREVSWRNGSAVLASGVYVVRISQQDLNKGSRVLVESKVTLTP